MADQAELSRAISDDATAKLYAEGKSIGAWGAKLLGAGGGGFMLFLVHPDKQEALRKRFGDARASAVRMEDDGAVVDSLRPDPGQMTRCLRHLLVFDASLADDPYICWLYAAQFAATANVPTGSAGFLPLFPYQGPQPGRLSMEILRCVDPRPGREAKDGAAEVAPQRRPCRHDHLARRRQEALPERRQ